MRRGFLGSIAALAAGAGAAWGQPPVEPAGAPLGVPGTPGLVEPAPVEPSTVAPQPPPGGPPKFGGFPPRALPGNAGFAPPATIMPPGNYGPPFDPIGIGPPGGFGPPPGPMYPMPGPYGAQSYQPAPMRNGEDRLAGLGDAGCGSAPHWWFQGEYLLWFTQGQKIRSPLLTTSAPSDAGMLGAASTTVLVGNRDLGYNAMSGMRLTAGFFGDADRRLGFEITGFFTEQRANNQSFGSLTNTAGIPTFARPFVDANGVPSTVVVSGPSLGPAVVRVGTTTHTWGIEPVGLWNVYRTEPGGKAWSLNLLAGYQFLELRESVYIQSTTALSGGMNAAQTLPIFQTGPFGTVTQVGTTFVPSTTNVGGVMVTGPALLGIRDQFHTINQFNGFVVGLQTQGHYGIVTSSAYGKIAVGEMHERLDITGGSSFAALGNVGAAYGGVLANASNIGSYTHDRFSYIPQGGLTLGIALTRHLSGFIGGSVIYFPNVIRPGDQINPTASSAALPFSTNYGAAGATRVLGFPLREVDHWLGGVNFGLKLQY